MVTEIQSQLKKEGGIRNAYEAIEVALAVLFAFFGPGWAVGLWLAVLWMRCLGTVSNFRAGLTQAPANWQRLMWAEDATHLPELIPGAGGIVLSAGDAWRAGGDFIPSAALKLVALIWIAPALMWRYSFKATIWFYWPIMLIAEGRVTPSPATGKRLFTWCVDALKRPYNCEAREDWLASTPRSGIAVLAYASLILSALTLFANHQAAQELLEYYKVPFILGSIAGQSHSDSTLTLPYFTAFYVTDAAAFWSFQEPWHWPRIAVCVMAIWLYRSKRRCCDKWDYIIRRNSIKPPEQHERFDFMTLRITLMVLAWQLLVPLLMIYFLLLGYWFVGYANDAGMLPGLLPWISP